MSIPIPLSVYCASKYAVTGMMHSLRNEMEAANLSIKVTVIFSYFKFMDENYYRPIAIEKKLFNVQLYRWRSNMYS